MAILPIPNLTEGQLKAFAEKVDKLSHDECWEWKGTKLEGGYGQVRIDCKCYLAHRVSWVLFFGEIPEGTLVLHKCDNPSCINPYHLYLGSQQDNIDDKMKRGRWKGGLPLGRFLGKRA